MTSIFGMLGVDLTAPDHTTLSRRGQHLVLRLALLAFKRTYNEQWMLEKYAYRSPAQVRRDLVGLDAAA